ncbi:hypothetical protein [Rhodococcus sp. IEGM 1318]|uniref:hypothetical protein n=1 Tax=Rhodococcus sp. IEGM 1318 TaxID=3082226 RepID=UPI002955D605|nr:hypothetical protein [Rhodococcus sp. IEGM 1318]MDV8009150.1 hypothetical protein [Rhodococcus sp. IEGM 1318]
MFNNHGPSNNAVDSADFSQTISAGEQADDIFAVTDALEKYITESLANADEVEDIIANLRVESAHPQSNKQSLRALLGGAILAVPVAAGTDIGERRSPNWPSRLCNRLPDTRSKIFRPRAPPLRK